MADKFESQDKKADIRKNAFKRMLQVFTQVLLSAVILFVSSGHITWLGAWMFLGVYILIILLNAFILPLELMAERGQFKENIKKWDKVITSLSIIPALGMLVVAGLDNRFGWSPQFNKGVPIVSIVLFIAGNLFFSWAMRSNYFFSTNVRIQFDRNHTVATTGPYHYVRHPGYVGYITFSLATPLVLGSVWALVPAFITACLFVFRTSLEDRTLMKELEGYKDYAEEVRYRLVPGIW